MQKIVTYTILFFLFAFHQVCGQSLKLNNINQYVNIGDLDITGNQLTVEAKIFMSTSTIYAMNIISKHTDFSNVNYLLRPKTFEISTSNGFFLMTNPYTLELNQWYHVAGTYDGQFVRYYVNGCLVIQNPASGNLIQNNLDTGIGNRTLNWQQLEQFDGSIDEVRIWNVCRSQNDIKNNMNELPNPTTQAGLKGYYKFSNNLLNSASNTNNGVAVGAIQYGTVSSITNPIAYKSFNIVANNCTNYSIEIIADGSDLQYSLDGVTFSSSNILTNVGSGTKVISIKSKEGCLISTTINLPTSTTNSPTGNSQQYFCANQPTIADIEATGTGIKWYDSASGGNVLANSTALVNGNTYYASQTNNGCESSSRLAVTVNLNNIQVTASSTNVCKGTTVTLNTNTTENPIANNCNLPTSLQNGLVGFWPFCGNANDESSNENNGTIGGATLTTDRYGRSDNAFNFDGINDFIETNRTHLNSFTASVWIKLNSSNCFSAIIDAYPSSWEFLSDCVSGTNLSAAIWNNSSTYQIYQSNYMIPQNIWTNVVMSYSNNILKIYSNGNLVYTGPTITPPSINGSFYFGRSRSGSDSFFKGSLDDIAIWNRLLTPNEIQLLQNPSPTYLWSTGETTASISPTPLVTTVYWVDVTTNGVACRKNITITVNDVPAPTGITNQQFCEDKTINDIEINGTDIKWYTTTTGTTTLNSSTTLTNGASYFASQTIDGCESINRFQTSISIIKIPTPTGEGIQKFCLEESPVISDLIVSGNNIVWFDALTNGSILDPKLKLDDNTTYFATTQDNSTGCESIQRLAVQADLIQCKVTAFNLITINGNALNDQLTFDDISYFPENSVKIYNRYGKLVWETTGYNNTTNAFKGKANVAGVYSKESFLPSGTYFFILVYNNTYINKQTELTGYLQIDNNK